jgi:hypothetical protein
MLFLQNNMHKTMYFWWIAAIKRELKRAAKHLKMLDFRIILLVIHGFTPSCSRAGKQCINYIDCFADCGIFSWFSGAISKAIDWCQFPTGSRIDGQTAEFDWAPCQMSFFFGSCQDLKKNHRSCLTHSPPPVNFLTGSWKKNTSLVIVQILIDFEMFR